MQAVVDERVLGRHFRSGVAGSTRDDTVGFDQDHGLAPPRELPCRTYPCNACADDHDVRGSIFMQHWIRAHRRGGHPVGLHATPSTHEQPQETARLNQSKDLTAGGCGVTSSLGRADCVEIAGCPSDESGFPVHTQPHHA